MDADCRRSRREGSPLLLELVFFWHLGWRPSSLRAAGGSWSWLQRAAQPGPPIACAKRRSGSEPPGHLWERGTAAPQTSQGKQKRNTSHMPASHSGFASDERERAGMGDRK